MRGQLVNWIEKAGLENIRRLLKITKLECSHELLLTAENLRELATCTFPYIIPIVPRLLPAELIEGEHFVLTDLCKSNSGSSSLAVASQEDQAEVAIGALIRFV